MKQLTSVITPMRSMSRAGLRGSSLGVECPLGGEEEAKEEAVAEAVMEAPWWCIRARLRPSRLTLATRFSISSARSSVDSFSSWISLGRREVKGLEFKSYRRMWWNKFHYAATARGKLIKGHREEIKGATSQVISLNIPGV